MFLLIQSRLSNILELKFVILKIYYVDLNFETKHIKSIIKNQKNY